MSRQGYERSAPQQLTPDGAERRATASQPPPIPGGFSRSLLPDGRVRLTWRSGAASVRATVEVNPQGFAGYLRLERRARPDRFYTSPVGAGHFATLTLDDGENKPTTRNRLKAAADRRALSITFRWTKDNTIVFSLGEKEDAS